jgi:glutamate-1-semialdehyde aminotransferase
MTWMAKWVGGHPVYAASAHGARIEDVDGNAYVDFSLGDTAAMAGHSPPATAAAVRRRLDEQGEATLMLPTEDAAWVGEELTPWQHSPERAAGRRARRMPTRPQRAPCAATMGTEIDAHMTEGSR